MVEVLLAIVGIWILAAGRVPDIVIGKKGYQIVGGKARLLGLILLLPGPLAIAAYVILFAFLGDKDPSSALGLGVLFEFAMFILSMVVAIVWVRIFRVPKPTS
jgi:hypothetical protein